MPSILIVDDQQSIRHALKHVFQAGQYKVNDASDGIDAVEKVRLSRPDVVLLDLKLPRRCGLEILQDIKSIDPGIHVIIITAYPGVDSAVDAMKYGAVDYVTKPFDLDVVVARVEELISENRASLSVKQKNLKDAGCPQHPLIVYKDKNMERCVRKVERASQSKNAAVLLTGESGTGKGLAARLIHNLGPRNQCPFVEINCSALAPHLVESELFGHEKGSFTDAKQTKKGLFEAAEGGTLFLDEIGDMDPQLQVKLLKVIEEKRVRRVGAVHDIAVDVRVIASTNKDLARAVEEGSFREDLYYRLNVIPIAVPPLRERREDIMPIAAHYIQQFCEEYGRGLVKISTSASNLLTSYHWPGNVRELRNVIERIFVLEEVTDEIEERHIGLSVTADVPLTPLFSGTLDQIECAAIEQVLTAEGWNIQRTSQILGINRTTLYNKIRKYGINR